MAIDTANKRSSAINISIPWRGMLPLPDGAIDQADRQHTAFMYAGITASALEQITGGVHHQWVWHLFGAR
jgi:hypothetical protein